jgi:hypothetical protein
MSRKIRAFLLAAALVVLIESLALAQGGGAEGGGGDCGCGEDEMENFGSFGTFYTSSLDRMIAEEDDEEYWYYDVVFPSSSEADKIERWDAWEKRLDRLPAGTQLMPTKEQPVFGASIPQTISKELFRKSFKPWLYRNAAGGAANWLFCQVTDDGDVKVFKPSIPQGKYYVKSKKEGYDSLVPLSVRDLVFLFPPLPELNKRIILTSQNTAELTPVWDYTLPDDIEGMVRYEVRKKGETKPRITRKLLANTTYEVTVIQDFAK